MRLVMAPAFKALVRSSAPAAILIAAALCALAGAAPAAPRWMHEALSGVHMRDGRHAPPPPVARYVIDDGGAFILDRSTRAPLLKFDDSPEIWVLWPSRGPRGDIIYKNDVGEPMLRATRLGGVTVFTSRRPGGSAATVGAAATALRPAAIGPLGLYQRLFQDSIRATRAAQHLIAFDVPDADPASESLLADTGMVAMQAMIALSLQPEGRPILARINKIVFSLGKHPDVVFKNGVLTISLVPAGGVAGRPSSRRILLALAMSRP